MSHTTFINGVYNCNDPDAWVLVHDNTKVIATRQGGQSMSGIHIIVDFDTKAERDQAIIDLGLTPLPDELQ